MPVHLQDNASYLLDLDGTLVRGEELLPGAGELLRLLGDRAAIVSNDSEHTPEQLSERFRSWGIDLPPNRIALAGVAAVDAALVERAEARLLLLGSAALQHYAEGQGAVLVREQPDIVLVARDRRFDFDSLATAARAVENGATVFLACPDLRHPGSDGYPVPEAGALGAALSAVTGKPADRVIGKPHPDLFRMACRQADLDLGSCAVIGDNPLTDGKGAADLGLPFIHVNPGELPLLLRELVA